MENWNRWHFFPGTGPDGATPPHEEIEVECKHKHEPLLELQIVDVRWDIGKPNYGLDKNLQFLRWRHRDPTQAQNWQAWRDEQDAAAKARREEQG